MNSKDKTALLMSALFIIGGLFILWFTTSILHIQGEVTHVALLLLPIVIYLMLSDRIKEFKGPGGIEVVLNTPIKSLAEIVQPINPSNQDLERVEKMGMIELNRQLDNIDDSKSVYMTIKLSVHIRYSALLLQNYLDRLSQFRNFKLVVFIDKNDKFIGYMPVWKLKNILSGRNVDSEIMIQRHGDFMNIINDDLGSSKISNYSGVISERVYSDFTYAQALQKMTDLNIEALVVLNKNELVTGIVDREQVISKILLGT